MFPHMFTHDDIGSRAPFKKKKKNIWTNDLGSGFLHVCFTNPNSSAPSITWSVLPDLVPLDWRYWINPVKQGPSLMSTSQKSSGVPLFEVQHDPHHACMSKYVQRWCLAPHGLYAGPWRLMFEASHVDIVNLTSYRRGSIKGRNHIYPSASQANHS